MQRSLIHECMLEREDYVPSRAMPAVPLSFHRSPRVFSHSRTKKNENLVICFPQLHFKAIQLLNLVYQLAVLILSTGKECQILRLGTRLFRKRTIIK